MNARDPDVIVAGPGGSIFRGAVCPSDPGAPLGQSRMGSCESAARTAAGSRSAERSAAREENTFFMRIKKSSVKLQRRECSTASGVRPVFFLRAAPPGEW